MKDTAKTLVAGLVTIGIITAAFLPGRQTVNGLNSAFSGTQGLFKTAING